MLSAQSPEPEQLVKHPNHGLVGRPDPTVPIVLYFDSAGPGGTAVYAVNVGSVLRSLGYRVATMCSAAASLAPIRNELARDGVAVHVLPEESVGIRARARRWMWFLSVLRRYPNCILLLLLGNHQSGAPVILAGRAARVRTIVRADLQPPEPPFHWWRDRLMLKLVDPLVDAIVVGSRESEEKFVSDTGRSQRNFSVVHTGIDLERYVPDSGRAGARAAHGYSPETLVVGTIARLGEERKGISYFLEMAAMVSDAAPDARFLIVGDGPLQADLERRAEQLHIGERVRFAGWRWDHTEQLAAMDIFVMPSTYEGGPTIVLEAMAMAKPVLATRVGMVPEVITSGVTGLIVDPGSAEQLAACLELLLKDGDLRSTLGARARAHAIQNFSRETMVDRYLAVIGRTRLPRHARPFAFS